jgi:hypothetical protein
LGIRKGASFGLLEHTEERSTGRRIAEMGAAVTTVLWDKESSVRQRRVLSALAFSFLAALPPLAADPIIQRGIDTFVTWNDGKTFYDFAYNPIPAGFFCDNSKAFTGRVVLKGLPLTTTIPGQLRGADTIIERLDDAAFDAKGVAVTRIQFRALSMVSVAPIKTSCGAFHLYVSLDGPQRVTAMSIHRTQESGGSFIAPLMANARFTFIPVRSVKTRNPRKLELKAGFSFPAIPLPWSFNTEEMKSIGSVAVDTNGDLSPDTRLPGISNFSAGMPPDLITAPGPIGPCPCPQPCHMEDGCVHCYWPSNCYPVRCDD